MKKILAILFILLLVTLVLSGCNDTKKDNNENGNNGDDGGSATDYTNFTNGQFSVEYPSSWTVYTEVKTGATITTEAYLLAEEPGGPGLYIRGHIIDEGVTEDYSDWYSSTLETLQNTEDTTILNNELSTNMATIEFTQLESGSVTVYTKYKFIGCIATTYQCTASVENALRSQYQNQIDHVISSFTCVE